MSGPDAVLDDLINNAPCGYVFLNAEGRIEIVNATFLAWSGRTKESIIGKRFGEVLTLPGRIYFETHVTPLLRMQGFFDEFAIDAAKADGRPIQTIANANERRNPDGTATGIRIALIRATDRRRYEQELLQSRETAVASEGAVQELLRLEHETSELREQFIAVLGHDLRNPLASIGAAARILDRTVQGEKEHQVISMLQATVQRMASMIDNILDFARGRMGGGISVQPTMGRPLEPTLALVVDELRLASPGRVIEANFTIKRPVRCDHSRIGQLLSNLLGNALTHGTSELPINVQASTGDDFFEIWVANQGEPIPSESIEKLFEPFVRGQQRASRQGLGLGLYIASQIAKAHGGTLDVASTPEETRFTFRMPLETQQQAP
jgi:phosphoserine phosphatase RsbU/P